MAIRTGRSHTEVTPIVVNFRPDLVHKYIIPLVRSASPLYGEHNGLVFRGLLGLSEDELAPLYARRAVADEPSEDLPGPIRSPR